MEPKIRFKGFEGEWKTPSIGEVFELRNGYTPSKAVNEFWEGGTIPWFRMEDIRTNGGILKDAIQHITPLAVKGAGLFEKNSIILATTATIGVHAMLIADSLANQQFTNFRVRKSLSDSYIDNFLYYSFFNIDEWSKKNTNSGGLLSVNMPLLVKQPLYSPCKQEQQAIASYFTSLDSQISASTSRLASLKQMKAASLQAMFPQEGETVPKIRFKGFEGEWTWLKLGDISEQVKRKAPINSTAPVMMISALNGFINQSEKYSDNNAGSSLANYTLLKKGELSYNHGYSKTRNFGSCFNLLVEEARIPFVYHSFRLTNDNDSFYAYYLNSGTKDKDLKRLVSSTARMDGLLNISFKNYMELSVPHPSLAEQQAIANYFTSLDRQISLQSQRLEKLKQIKSACLDKMFV